MAVDLRRFARGETVVASRVGVLEKTWRWFRQRPAFAAALSPVWNATTFTKNRDRLLDGEIAAKFLAAVLADPKVRMLLSDEHFSVDGTLLKAWASPKSFRPKDGSGEPPGPASRTSRCSGGTPSN